MTKEVFQEQMKRLENVFGERAYPAERQRVLWTTFQRVQDETFVDVVSYLIANFRSTPLLKEFHEACERCERERKERDRYNCNSRNSIEFLQKTYDPGQYKDPMVRQRIEGRLKLVRDYWSGQITQKQFIEGCNFYDRASGIEVGNAITNMTENRKDYLEWKKK